MATGYTVLLLVGFRYLFALGYEKMVAKSNNPVSQLLIALVFCLLFISSWITEIIGIHAIFGAFLFGLAVPRSNNLEIKLTEKIEDVIIVGFLPLVGFWEYLLRIFIRHVSYFLVLRLVRNQDKYWTIEQFHDLGLAFGRHHNSNGGKNHRQCPVSSSIWNVLA